MERTELTSPYRIDHMFQRNISISLLFFEKKITTNFELENQIHVQMLFLFDSDVDREYTCCRIFFN